jgi:hypothetical protein
MHAVAGSSVAANSGGTSSQIWTPTNPAAAKPGYTLISISPNSGSGAFPYPTETGFSEKYGLIPNSSSKYHAPYSRLRRNGSNPAASKHMTRLPTEGVKPRLKTETGTVAVLLLRGRFGHHCTLFSVVAIVLDEFLGPEIMLGHLDRLP